VPEKDSILPFVFDRLPVRGALVQLEGAWQRMLQGHEYSAPVVEVLGHAAAAISLLAQSLKFDGSVTLQISGDGPLRMLVMQCTDRLDLRGMALASDDAHPASFAELVTGARCAVTIDAGAMERPYQGIVDVSPHSLAASLENYFDQSVQIPSHLVLVASSSFCGGILLQKMPGEVAMPEDDWQRLGFLLATLRATDLVEGATTALLRRLFAEDDVRVFGVRPVRFHCRCSQSKVEEVLRFLGESETRAALAEEGIVNVTCEYCGRMRSFDAIDVSRVFSGQVLAGTTRLH
jgi:molecular chaperone Hsp33